MECMEKETNERRKKCTECMKEETNEKGKKSTECMKEETNERRKKSTECMKEEKKEARKMNRWKRMSKQAQDKGSCRMLKRPDGTSKKPVKCKEKENNRQSCIKSRNRVKKGHMESRHHCAEVQGNQGSVYVALLQGKGERGE